MAFSFHYASIMVFGHFLKKDQKTVFDKLVSVVKPGGIVMLEVYSENQLSYGTGGPKSVDMVYHPADILQWIQGYKVLHFFYGEQESYSSDGTESGIRSFCPVSTLT
jgi:hypothetical protein